MRQTTMAKPSTVTRQWYVVDGAGLTLGRLASEVAAVLRGKHKPTYTPNVDCGDFVIIVNADKIEVTGNKLDGKKYYNHSGYAGGLRVRSARTMKEHYTIEEVLEYNEITRIIEKICALEIAIEKRDIFKL